MITPADIDFQAEIKLLDLLRKTGVETRKIASLQHLLFTIMTKNNMKGVKGKRTQSPHSIVNILLDELAVQDVSSLLTGALHEAFEHDIVTAQAIANLFGDTICFTVDILTWKETKRLSGQEYYESVVGRFNRANFKTEKRVMTIVAILLLTKRIHLLLSSDSTTRDEQLALYTSTVNSFLPKFSNKLDISKVDADLAAYFFKAKTLLADAVLRAGKKVVPANDLPVAQNTMAPRLSLSTTVQ